MRIVPLQWGCKFTHPWLDLTKRKSFMKLAQNVYLNDKIMDIALFQFFLNFPIFPISRFFPKILIFGQLCTIILDEDTPPTTPNVFISKLLLYILGKRIKSLSSFCLEILPIPLYLYLGLIMPKIL